MCVHRGITMYKILNKIHSSADVQALTTDELELLCTELRKAILENVSKTGGHLASNLGAVEITAAIHRVYDTDKDRLVFDVGHQCYAHKMISGRLDEFPSLRKFEGISGFPKPRESASDACISGHASCSISNALGMARARTLKGEDYDVVALIGDGALTGGLAYEGLSDCGDSGEPIVIILNDNEMSIDRNVGGLARMLADQRVRNGYIVFKKFYRRYVSKCRPLYRVLHKVKEYVKDIFMPDNMFEKMGFYYLGPIDGHDMKTLVRTLRYAREVRVPTIVHVVTVKGKGYEPAEKYPEIYHGVGAFDIERGVEAGGKRCFSTVFGSKLCQLAGDDPSIVGITAAMVSGTGMDGFAAKYPKRFYDVGIAEGHAVSMAAGMAKQGMKPVFAVYSSFLQRSYDMLLHDVGLDGLPVVFGVDRSGIVGADGETHQGVYSTGYLCQVPGMAVYAPASYAELESMLSEAFTLNAPAAVCYPRGQEGEYKEDNSRCDECIIKEGSDLTLVCYGIMVNEALKAARLFEEKGVSLEIIKLSRLDKADYPFVYASAKKTGKIIIAEESARRGSMGTRLLAGLLRNGVSVEHGCGVDLGSGIVEHGTVAELRKKYGIDAEAIVKLGMEWIDNEKSKA